MKIIAITYGTVEYSKLIEFNKKMCIKYGCVDEYISYTPENIDSIFMDNNKAILSQKKGAGYYLWKPYIINDAMNKINNDDYLIYLDCGSSYVCNSLKPIIELMESRQKCIMTLSSSFIERSWTKRDTFILMECDSKIYTDTVQTQAQVIILKKCQKSIDLVNNWLNYSRDSRIITDADNTCGLENYPGFIEHRYDQSILSLLTKKTTKEIQLQSKFYSLNFILSPQQILRQIIHIFCSRIHTYKSSQLQPPLEKKEKSDNMDNSPIRIPVCYIHTQSRRNNKLTTTKLFYKLSIIICLFHYFQKSPFSYKLWHKIRYNIRH